MSDDELRSELVRKARRQGIKVTKDMTTAEIEDALSRAAFDMPHALPESNEDKPEEEPAIELAAEQPEIAKPEEPPPGTVLCRITKAGAGLIFTGVENKTYNWNDMVWLPEEIAKKLEERHFLEIQP